MITATQWKHMEEGLRRRMQGAIDADPQSLFECDGGPLGQTADLILARLIGFDDQVVDDTLRLSKVESLILAPIPERLTLAIPDEPFRPLRTAEYVLQSGYARYALDPMYAPPGVEPTAPDFLVNVLFLRYRRRR